ncbi:MAG: ACP S-malonyltransferase [Actinomycetota bacterium]|nr:ACP S-malonyltransferase [Actinomycetota bacterium]
MRYAVLFPGQGSQYVGMGAELFEARPDLLGEPADRVLGWSLQELCLEGPEEELTRTDRAQPALYAVAYALWDAFRRKGAHLPAAATGHSLGEYTALAAAGAVDFFTGLHLVAARGRAMEEAGAGEPSGMAALLGMDAKQAEEMAMRRRSEGGRLWVANLNAPAQVVLAGSARDIAWVVDEARQLGARRAMPLNVSAGFHCPFMADASRELRAALAKVTFRPLAFPVWSNVTAGPVGSDELDSVLAEQLVAPVRFSETLEAMAASGVAAFVHVGPGEATAGMARRTVPQAEVLVIDELAAAGAAVKRLGEPIE